MQAGIWVANAMIVLGLGAVAWHWPPAAFGFLVVGPLALLAVSGASRSGPSARTLFLTSAGLSSAGVVGLGAIWPTALFGAVVVVPIVALGLVDMLQTKQAVRRNFPVIGHARYLLEAIRPELNQYFIESNTDGRPFSREERSLVYQRAKGDVATVPFGTQRDLYEVGAEWMSHSLVPKTVSDEAPRVAIGVGQCSRPYRSALLNVAAMSFGALSANAITALNRGARSGGFAHNSGEGGISDHHLEGGDLIWQIGTGYFGCRDEAGTFDPERFAERSGHDAVKMIEVKLSQGAKPGHGGILPAAKITPEIARIRGVGLDRDVVSPPAHTAFSTPIELLEFLTALRELSGGKPVGIKLCIGKRREFLAICKAMHETRLLPDYIAVDGAEGGTGAAPLEFSNTLGFPVVEGLIFVHNALVGVDLRDRIRVGASGKIVSGFGMAKLLAIGADFCYSARAMMMALGCIQARRCNHNDCPVGVATQNPVLAAGLDIEHKSGRVERYQRETVAAALELTGAAGLERVEDLRPWHIMRRVAPTEVRHYGEIHPFLEPGALLSANPPEAYARPWHAASSTSFESGDDKIA